MITTAIFSINPQILLIIFERKQQWLFCLCLNFLVHHFRHHHLCDFLSGHLLYQRFCLFLKLDFVLDCLNSFLVNNFKFLDFLLQLFFILSHHLRGLLNFFLEIFLELNQLIFLREKTSISLLKLLFISNDCIKFHLHSADTHLEISYFLVGISSSLQNLFFVFFKACTLGL
jgi:hypothetical protein